MVGPTDKLKNLRFKFATKNGNKGENSTVLKKPISKERRTVNSPLTRALANNQIQDIISTSIENFEGATLPDFPSEFENLKRARGFAKEVRAKYIDCLPYFYIKDPTTPIYWCPWCMHSIPIDGMHVDHVIAKRIYVRYRIFQDFSKGERFRDHDADTYLDHYLHETINLVLSCASCNVKKQDKLVTAERLRTLKFNSDKYPDKWEIRDKIDQAVAIRKVYGEEESDHRKYMTSGDIGFIGGSNLEKAGVTALENRMKLWGGDSGRPAFRPKDVHPTLQVQQLANQHLGYGARLCFYCLGFYHPSAFQIDHINAKKRGTTYTLKTNNVSGNLFPVCARCNNKKREKTFSFDMLNDFINERRNAEIPGIELTDWVIFDDVATAVERAQARVIEIFISKVTKKSYADFIQNGAGHSLYQLGLID